MRKIGRNPLVRKSRHRFVPFGGMIQSNVVQFSITKGSVSQQYFQLILARSSSAAMKSKQVRYNKAGLALLVQIAPYFVEKASSCKLNPY